MNDFYEVKWSNEHFKTAVEINPNKHHQRFFQDVRLLLDQLIDSYLPLTVCFSNNGDLLSQWRAYADGGRGVAIGFSPQDLGNNGIYAHPVDYDPNTQSDFYFEVFDLIYGFWLKRNSSERAKQRFRQLVANLFYPMTLMKNGAFREEEEFRATNLQRVIARDNNFIAVDEFNGEPAPIQVSVRNNMLVPYKDIFINPELDFIKRVIVGPRCECTFFEISLALTSNNVFNVDLDRSVASYR